MDNLLMSGSEYTVGVALVEVGRAPPIHDLREGLRGVSCPPTDGIPLGRCFTVRDTPNLGQRASERTKQ